MDSLRVVVAIACVIACIAAVGWLAYLASYYAWFWLGLWGAIPVGIVAGSLAIGAVCYGFGFLALLSLGGRGR